MNKLVTTIVTLASLIISRITVTGSALIEAPLTTCGGDFQEVEAFLYPSATLYSSQEAYLFLSYVAPYQVDSGYTITTLNINGAPYPESRSDLTPCPITAARHESNISFPVPGMDGVYKLKTGWFTNTNTLLLCLKMLFEVIPPNPLHQ